MQILFLNANILNATRVQIDDVIRSGMIKVMLTAILFANESNASKNEQSWQTS